MGLLLRKDEPALQGVQVLGVVFVFEWAWGTFRVRGLRL